MPSNGVIRLVSKTIEITVEGSDFWPIVAEIKHIAGRQFKRWPEKHWEIPAGEFEARQVINRLGKWYDIPEEIKARANEAREKMLMSRRTTTRGGDKRLYPYQNVAVEFIDMAEGRVILADDFGLGKTVEALVWADQQKDINRVLVVCPANVLYKWLKECGTWTPRLTAAVVETTKSVLPDTDILLMTYAIMTRRRDELLGIADGFDLLILDECHAIKNYKPTKGGQGSQRAVAAQKIAMLVKYVLALSGSPLLNRPIELWPILKAVQKGTVEWRAFGFSYAGGVNGLRATDGTYHGFFQGATNLEELRNRLSTVMIRRLKGEVLRQLPPLTRTIIPVAVDLTEYKQVKKEVVEALRKLNPQHKGYFINALDRISALRMAVGRAKVEPAIEWATNLLENTEPNVKLVIYAHHIEVLNAIKAGLEKFGVDEISGRIGAKERAVIIENYQSGRDKRALIVTSAGAEGIDLFGREGVDSSRILFVEREYVPAIEDQAEGRLHRRGQHAAVEAVYLVAAGTIDEWMDRVVGSKRGVIKQVVAESEYQTIIIRGMIQELLDS